MHPVIRIVSFLVLAGFVAFGGIRELALGFVLVLCVVLYKRLRSIELSARIIKRMRWLFVSILIVYLWFTPGKSILPVAHSYLPTIEGLTTGLLRVLSLVLLIFAVNYFIASIARIRLVGAIVWLLYPLERLGIDNRQLALRIALILELIPSVQQIVLDLKQHQLEVSPPEKQSSQSRVSKARVLSRIARVSYLFELLFERVIDAAVKMPPERMDVGGMQRPQFYQWIIPIGIFAMFWGLKYLP